MHAAGCADQGEGDDGGADLDLAGGAGAVGSDGAAEFVAEHDSLVRASEAVVASLGQHVGLGVGVVSGVEVGPADAATGHIEQYLPGTRGGVSEFDDVQVGVLTDNRSQISKKDAAIVIGCGPVGLAIICMLKQRGVHTIVASDLSAGRRALALACGATVVVDPTSASPYDELQDRRYVTSIATRAAAGLKGLKGLQKLPVPWHLVLRGLDKVGVTKTSRPVIFECVGVPGIIEQIITAAPMDARVVVAGVCMEADRFRPAMAINKEIDLRFVVGYGPLEFRDTLHLLADGKLDVSPLVTGTVGLDGVVAAFTALATPDTHAKLVIDPRSTATTPA